MLFFYLVLDTKVLHLMKGINMLFKSKAKASKSKVDVIQLLEVMEIIICNDVIYIQLKHVLVSKV